MHAKYTASKNYMQISFFVILYGFLNQCFGNLYSSWYCHIRICVHAKFYANHCNNQQTEDIYCLLTAEITVQIYMQHKKNCN